VQHSVISTTGRRTSKRAGHLPADLEILLMQAHLEAERIGPAQHVRPRFAEEPAPGSTLAQRLDEPVDRKRLPARAKASASLTAWLMPCDHDLVDGLRGLSGAHGPKRTIVRPIAESIGRARSKACCHAADHDRERGLAGAFSAAGDGTVEEFRAALAHALRSSARRISARRRAVEHERTGLQFRRERVDHLEQVRVRGHAGDDDLALARERGGIGAGAAADLGDERERLLGRAAPHRVQRSRAVEVACHRQPHGAEPDEAGLQGELLRRSAPQVALSDCTTA
jgi:hypothetical protein